jgi:hypothetical protein
MIPQKRAGKPLWRMTSHLQVKVQIRLALLFRGEKSVTVRFGWLEVRAPFFLLHTERNFIIFTTDRSNKWIQYY